MRRLAALTGPALLWALVAPGIALAGEPAEGEQDGPRSRSDIGAPMERPIRFEHRFSFRFRGEILVGGHLGPGSSGVPTPLEATEANGSKDATTLSWASLRLRYEPALYLGQHLQIRLGIDALDNLVMGSTHVNAGGEFNRGLWDDSAGSPSAGLNSWEDALKIRYAYINWRLFDVLDMGGGRFNDSFGLGIVRHAGDCADCDFGSSIDAIRLGVTLAGIRIEGTWEYTAVGVTSARPGWHTRVELEDNAELVGQGPGWNQSGQPYDLGQDDDVTTFSVRVTSEPLTGKKLEEYERKLNIDRDVGISWGVFSTFTDQTYSSNRSVWTADKQCPTMDGDSEPRAYELENKTEVLDWHCYMLVPRNVFLWRPSLWFKLEARPEYLLEIRAEIEAAGLVGSIGSLAMQGEEELGSTEKDIAGFAAAAELEIRWDRLLVGLDTGFATGDDRRYLGFLDGQNVAVLDDSEYVDDRNVSDNKTITSFWFHRDYRIDLILFRQVIGGITNAVYVRPWVGYRMLDAEDMRLDARLDILYAAPVKPTGSPGQGDHYGVEIDASLNFTMGGFELSAAAGVLVPLEALRDRDTGAMPEPAYTVQALMTWRYE